MPISIQLDSKLRVQTLIQINRVKNLNNHPFFLTTTRCKKKSTILFIKNYLKCQTVLKELNRWVYNYSLGVIYNWPRSLGGLINETIIHTNIHFFSRTTVFQQYIFLSFFFTNAEKRLPIFHTCISSVYVHFICLSIPNEIITLLFYPTLSFDF